MWMDPPFPVTSCSLGLLSVPPQFAFLSKSLVFTLYFVKLSDPTLHRWLRTISTSNLS